MGKQLDRSCRGEFAQKQAEVADVELALKPHSKFERKKEHANSGPLIR